MRAKEFIPSSRPRNFVAKNAMKTTSGAGAHRDKKKDQKQGYEKHKNKSVEEGWGHKEYEIDGWTYSTYEDRDDDVTKIFHTATSPEGKNIDMDFSPYDHFVPKKIFKLWLKLGMPSRKDMPNKIGPMEFEDIIKMAQIKGIANLDPELANAKLD